MDNSKIYPIEMRIADQAKPYSAEFQSDPQYAQGWKQVLLRAYGKADVRCRCPGPGEKRLSIHSSSKSDRFHLARFPDTGAEHSEDCIYYGVDPNMSGLGTYRRGVIQELDDGATKIKLKVGLQKRASAAPGDAREAQIREPKLPAGRPRSSQASMTLLGLLHYLWTQARLNTWSPAMADKRNLAVVHHHLMRSAATTYAGRVRLAQNLLVATPSSSGQQASYNKAKSLEAVTQRRRLVVIAPLAQHQDGMDGSNSLPIAGFHCIPYLSMDEGGWSSLERRFGREIDAWRAGNPVIAIVQTDPPRPSGGSIRAQVVDVALMQITQDWIPVDSGYEVLVAEKLVAEKRRFEKPLRFDAGEDRVFPDFWLRDVASPLPCEVWGMSNADYLTRKLEKTAHYNETYGEPGWWSWNAAASEPIPMFPASTT